MDFWDTLLALCGLVTSRRKMCCENALLHPYIRGGYCLGGVCLCNFNVVRAVCSTVHCHTQTQMR